jgi:hypothetical protein
LAACWRSASSALVLGQGASKVLAAAAQAGVFESACVSDRTVPDAGEAHIMPD